MAALIEDEIPNRALLADELQNRSGNRGLVSAQISAVDLRANVRTRPATTATPMPQTDIYDTGGSELNFDDITWKTCQGTWSGSTCVHTLPECDY